MILNFIIDTQIRKIAIQEARIIITKDQDSLDYFLIKGAPPNIPLIDMGNTKNKDLFKIIRANLNTLENLFQISTMVVIQPDKLLSY